MNRFYSVRAILLILAVVLASCPPPPPPPGPVAESRLILDQLRSRRDLMNPMEANVKFMFPEGTFLTSSLEGHAAYRLDTDTARLRVAAVGPLGAISLDLLVEQSDFLVRLPGYTEPLGQADLCVIYGDSPLIRTPTVLAKRPGFYFGGIPEGVSDSWTFKEDEEGKWLIHPNEKGTQYLIKDNPAMILRAILHDKDIGRLEVELERWEETEAGPIPTRITTRFDGRVLFSLKVRDWSFGALLPDNVFKLESGGRGSEL